VNPGRFFAELKRRNVYKVAVAYAVVGWLVIQISSTVLPTFHAPEWVVQTFYALEEDTDLNKAQLRHDR